MRLEPEGVTEAESKEIDSKIKLFKMLDNPKIYSAMELKAQALDYAMRRALLAIENVVGIEVMDV